MAYIPKQGWALDFKNPGLGKLRLCQGDSVLQKGSATSFATEGFSATMSTCQRPAGTVSTSRRRESDETKRSSPREEKTFTYAQTQARAKRYSGTCKATRFQTIARKCKPTQTCAEDNLHGAFTNPRGRGKNPPLTSLYKLLYITKQRYTHHIHHINR